MMNDVEKLGEKRFLDNLAAVSERIMAIGFGVLEKGGTSNDDLGLADREEIAAIRRLQFDKCSPTPTTNSFLGKRKIYERESQHHSQQNPNHASSSSSNKPMKLWGRYYGSEPIIREPVRQERERKHREPGRREAVREREAVRREPVRRRTPEWLVNVMREVNGVDAKLVIEKELTNSDVNRGHARLLIPFNAVEDRSFLNEQELRIIDEKHRKIREKGVDVTLIDPKGVRWELNLRRWDMNSSSNYTLVTGWNNVTFYNRKLLKAGHRISLWSFRSPQRLYFALVPHQAQAILPPPLPAPALEPLALALPPPPLPAEPLALVLPPPPSALALPPPPPPPPHPVFDEERDTRIFVSFPRKRLRFACVPPAHAPPPPVLAEASHKAKEERDRGRNFPKPMRSSQVEVPSPAPSVTRDSEGNEGLELLAAVACADMDPSPPPSDAALEIDLELRL